MENGIKRLYAVFDKSQLGRDMLIMYEVDSPEDLFYRELPTGEIMMPRGRTTAPGYLVPRSRSARFQQPQLSESIVVYEDYGMMEMEEQQCPESEPDRERCQLDQPRTRTVLRLPGGHPSTIIEENEAVFEPLTPTAGVLQHSWTVRRGCTPPPYVTMDNRRRATVTAEIDREKLPVTSFESPFIRDMRESVQTLEENMLRVKAEPAYPDYNDDFMDGNDSDHSQARPTLQEAPGVRLRDPVLQARQDRDYQETFPPTLGARPRDQQSQPVTHDEKLEQIAQYRARGRPLSRRPARNITAPLSQASQSQQERSVTPPRPAARAGSSDLLRAERVVQHQRKKGKRVKVIKSEPE